MNNIIDNAGIEEQEKHEQIWKEIVFLREQLMYGSVYGDWKNMKQLDCNCYSEEEMNEYRKGRAEIREKINELENQLGLLLKN